MAQVHQVRNRRGELGDLLGMSIGQGLAGMANDYYATKAIKSVTEDKSLENAPFEKRMGRLQEALRPFGERGQKTFENLIGIEQEGEKRRATAKAEASEKKAQEQKAKVAEYFNLPPGTPDSVMAAFVNQSFKGKNQQALLDFVNGKSNTTFSDLNTQENQPQNAPEINPNQPLAGVGANQPEQMLQRINPNQPTQQNPPAPLPPAQSGLAGKTEDELIRMQVIPGAKDAAKAELDRRNNLKETERKNFLEERKYHTQLGKDTREEAEGLQKSLPKKERALSYARHAIESGKLGYFSKDKLADATGVDLFRSAVGAELITASKENLLSNMDRVSAKAQNLWFEQRLNTMFPKIGQSKEANLAIQEMLEGELALDKAYLDEYHRLEEGDMQQYGFVKGDISKRAHNNMQARSDEIFNRSVYRLKELEEQEKGLQNLQKEVGEKVIQGTPLTLQMAKLYHDKFGKEAHDKAQADGYQIPTQEEFMIFEQRPQQFLKGNK